MTLELRSHIPARHALVAAGLPRPVAGIAKCLGLKLSLPFRWTSRSATVQSSGRMSNPADWWLLTTPFWAALPPISSSVRREENL
jgi:hypothetical protein